MNTIFKKISILALTMATSVITACADANGSTSANAPVEDTTVTTQQTTVVTTPEPVQNPVVNITVEGDNLIHSSIYNQANARANYEGYDFSYAYEHVAKLFSGDLNIMNQETLICNDEYPPADYPQFNSPVALGDYMIKLGINVFSMANNHMIDMGEDGLSACLDYWDTKYQQDGVVCYGAYRNEQDMQNIKTKEINGITFGFVAFTEYTNGLYLPEDSELQVIYTDEVDKMKSQIELADQVADVVVVSVHWGQEDSFEVTDDRKELAQNFADWGANVIIGCHPHVVQSMEFLTNKYGDQALVFYSLGNFISAQSDNFNLIGMVGDFNVTKDLSNNSILISDVKAKPIITHYGYGYSDVTVYPYDEYDDELASEHGIHTVSSGNYHDFDMQTIDGILKDNIPEEFLDLS